MLNVYWITKEQQSFFFLFFCYILDTSYVYFCASNIDIFALLNSFAKTHKHTQPTYLAFNYTLWPYETKRKKNGRRIVNDSYIIDTNLFNYQLCT